MGLAIAGFHRSGTSSFTQHLAQSGLDPGEDLIGANEYNAYGYFEDWEPVRFHDRVLRESGLDWASVTRADIGISEADRNFIRDYCARRAAQSSNWCFKDPRICQFLREWMETEDGLKALIVYRSPVECCWSIYRRSVRDFVRRNDSGVESRVMTQPDHALALWVTHNRRLLEVINDIPERTLVFGHAGLAAGFNAAEALRDRFGFKLVPVDVSATFHDNAATREVPALPVSDTTLRDEAVEIWEQLLRLDVTRPPFASLSFSTDSNGMILTNKILSMQVSETEKMACSQLTEAHRAFEIELGAANDRILAIRVRLQSTSDELRVAIEELRATKEKLQQTSEELQVTSDKLQDTGEELRQENDKMRAVHVVVKKLKRWPFSMFFERSKKYKALIDKIMG